MSELSELTAQRDDVMAELAEIEALSDEGRNRILDAIKAQRWYFFKNNKYILMDKLTGLLWANLDYFPYAHDYNAGALQIFEGDSGFSGWSVPSAGEIKFIVYEKNFPFLQGIGWRIRSVRDWKTTSRYISLRYP